MRIVLPKKIPSAYITGLLGVLRDLDIDVGDILRRGKLNADEVASRESHFERPQYLSVVQAALNTSGCEDLGFRVGRYQAYQERSALCLALLSCTTLAESLSRYQRYQKLLNSALATELTVDGDLAKITVEQRDRKLVLSEAQVSYFTQLWLESWSQWIPLVGATGGFFDHVFLAYPAQGNPEIYTDHLNCGVSFGHKQTEVVFPASFLDRTLEAVPETACNKGVADLDRLGIAPKNEQQGIIVDIHTRLARSPGCVPSMKDMSRSLQVSPRTLRRRLLGESKTYQQLIIDFRMALARYYLQSTDLPANEISVLAGYADTANFYRTFRKQNGMTPAAFRQLRSTTNESAGEDSLRLNVAH